jgi:hypothetical protein
LDPIHHHDPRTDLIRDWVDWRPPKGADLPTAAIAARSTGEEEEEAKKMKKEAKELLGSHMQDEPADIRRGENNQNQQTGYAGQAVSIAQAAAAAVAATAVNITSAVAAFMVYKTSVVGTAAAVSFAEAEAEAKAEAAAVTAGTVTEIQRQSEVDAEPATAMSASQLRARDVDALSMSQLRAFITSSGHPKGFAGLLKKSELRQRAREALELSHGPQSEVDTEAATASTVISESTTGAGKHTSSVHRVPGQVDECPAAAKPAGGYSRSCTKCTFYRNNCLLLCLQCKGTAANAKQRMGVTKLDIRECGAYEVDNKRGKLKCHTKPPRKPTT